MSVADNRISAVHQTGRDMLRTRARLAGWVEARERGVTSATSDAITDAALAGVIELLEMWEADAAGEPAEQPEPARGVGWRLARDEEIQAAAEQLEGSDG